jgi:hypothetical protein
MKDVVKKYAKDIVSGDKIPLHIGWKEVRKIQKYSYEFNGVCIYFNGDDEPHFYNRHFAFENVLVERI